MSWYILFKLSLLERSYFSGWSAGILALSRVFGLFLSVLGTFSSFAPAGLLPSLFLLCQAGGMTFHLVLQGDWKVFCYQVLLEILEPLNLNLASFNWALEA